VTSFLRLNGIVVPVATGSAGLKQEDIGGMRRAIDGTPVFSRRATKRRWSFKTTIRSAQESLAWRDLITGKGHVLSFDGQSLYTSKGLPPASTGANWSLTTVSPKYGAAMAQWTSTSSTWTFFTATSPWTIAYWLNQAAAGWHHYVQTSAGSKWIDGVATASSMLGFGGVSSGVATFGSATASKIDDIVALPYIVPSDWPAQIYGFGSAFGTLPRLVADGLFIEQNAVAMAVVGMPPDGTPVKAATAANLHSFSFELLEV
jgi:hypothetical protein